VVGWYRRELDRVLAARGWTRTSSGHSDLGFEPDLAKTFNRGFTTYLLHGRTEPPGALDSPKMVGELLGAVAATHGRSFVLDTPVVLSPGDGLCWFDAHHELCGTVINAVQPGTTAPGQVLVTPQESAGIHPGLTIYRNHDHTFLRRVERSRPVRKIAVHLRLETAPTGFVLHADDQDGNRATGTLTSDKVPAHKPDQAEDTTRRQLAKTGHTPFTCTGVDLAWERPYFLPVADLNTLRRDTLDRLAAVRRANHPVTRGEIVRNQVPYPETALTYHGNALNRQAVSFYQRHGVREVAPAAESGLDMQGRVVMRSRYCILHQLGLCDGTRRAGELRGPFFLVDEDGHRHALRFHCRECEMEIVY
jgi:putative protease